MNAASSSKTEADPPPGGERRPPGKHRPLFWVVIVGGIVVAAAVVAVVVVLLVATPRPFTSEGEVAVDKGVERIGSNYCVTTGTFADIHQGTLVYIEGAGSKNISVGKLARGLYIGSGICSFSFNVHNVAPGSKTYFVKVGADEPTVFSAKTVQGSNEIITYGNF